MAVQRARAGLPKRGGTVSGLLVLLLWTCLLLWGEAAFAQDENPCPSVIDYEAAHPNCSAYGCHELICLYEHYYSYVAVSNCYDPVIVDVLVIEANFGDTLGDYFFYSYTESETVEENNVLYTALIERNASHLGFILNVNATDHPNVTWLEPGEFLQVFEPMYFYLNSSVCMYDSLEEIAYEINLNIEDTHTNYSCFAVNSTYVECYVLDSSLEYVALEVHPCANPPSIDLTITVDSDRHVYNISQNRSVYVTDDNIEIMISLWHYDYSLDIQIVADLAVFTHEVLPRSKIILDLTECGPPQPFNISGPQPTPPVTDITPTPTTSTPTTPPSLNYSSCDALTSIVGEGNGFCSTNPACTALECVVSDHRVELAVLSCHDPPGIRVSIYNEDGSTFYNRSFYNGTHDVSIGGVVTLQVTIRQYTDIGAISLQVDVIAHTFLGDLPPLTIVPETLIPINGSSCVAPPPTSGPPTTTCEAMEMIGQGLQGGVIPVQCSFPIAHNCSSLSCSSLNDTTFELTLFRCAHPPAIEISMGYGSRILFDHTFDHSEVVPIAGGNNTSVNVTLDELCPSSIGLQVDFIIDTLTNESVPFIPYTIIPVNTTGCGPSGVINCTTTPPPHPTKTVTTTTTPSKTSTTSKSSSHTTVKPSPTNKPHFSNSCAAIDSIAQQLSPRPFATKCQTKNCSLITCDDGKFNLTLRCEKPYGFELQYNSTLYVGWGRLNKTVVQIDDKTFGFALSINTTVLVKYTLVPVDSYACPGSSSSSSSSGGGNLPVIVTASVVPILLLSLVIVAVAVTVIVLYRKRKFRNYYFRRMVMKEIDDEEEET